MLPTILAIAAGLVVVLLMIIASRPNTYAIQRVVTIQAPPEKIFPLINDFHQWQRWSSFEGLDPAMQRTYRGPLSGRGAVYEWVGNSQAGKGRMEITEVHAPSDITVDVDFAKPFVAHNVSRYSLEGQGAWTKVTWGMRGTQPFVLKAMSIFVSPDKLLGKHFETGLANLKKAAEESRAVQ